MPQTSRRLSTTRTLAVTSCLPQISGDEILIVPVQQSEPLHSVLDFAAIGGVFLLALLAPAGIADSALLDEVKEAPLLVLAGAVGAVGFDPPS